jgi:hypothetical protein
MKVGPHEVQTQSTTVTVLMMGQLLYLLVLVPTLELATAPGILRASQWLFQVLMCVHWWYGGQFYLEHLGPAKSLPDIYAFFALLGASWVPALFISSMAAYMFVFSAAFLIAFIRYRTMLPRLAEGGVKDYVRSKANVELAGFLLLLWGGVTGVLVTDVRLQAAAAPFSVVFQAVMIGYCVKKVYPLVHGRAGQPQNLSVLPVREAQGAGVRPTGSIG